MALILSQRICAKEFGKTVSEGEMTVLRRSAKVALATPIAGIALPRATKLLKAYATSPKGPRRVVYLLSVEGGDLFLLFYRGKNDPVGKNVTIKNPAFKTALVAHLRLLGEDIKSGCYDTVDLVGD